MSALNDQSLPLAPQQPLSDIPQRIRDFFTGKLSIMEFRALYDAHPEINDFLQSVIDRYVQEDIPFLAVPHRNGRICKDVEFFKYPERYGGYIYGDHPHTSVRDYLTQEFRMATTDVRSASGAWEFYQRLYNVFYQYDQSVPYDDEAYEKAFCFALNAIPEYLSGGEAELYINRNIIPLFPDSLPKGKRIKAIRQKIREEFRSEKGYPAWLQSSEWPLGADGKPTVYIGSKKKDGGESKEYYFKDESNGTVITIKQCY